MKQVLRGVMRSVCVIAFGLGAFFIGAGTTGSAAATYEARDVEVYDNSETDVRTMSCMFRDDMPNIPYVSVEEWLELTFPDTDFHVEKTGDKYRVYGTCEEETGSDMIIDTKKDTLTFEHYYTFILGSNAESLSTIDFDYRNIREVVRYDDLPEAYDFSRYGIDVYAKDGKVFFPVHTISDVMCESYAYPDYVDGKIYFARLDAAADTLPFIKKIEARAFETTSREADVADYAYRELCFVVDCLYGKTASGRSQEFIERLRKNGLDATLEAGGMIDFVDLKKVKTYLTSQKLAEYAAGMYQLSYLMYDGGHTCPYYAVATMRGVESCKNYQEEFIQVMNEDESVKDALRSLLQIVLRLKPKEEYFDYRNKGLKKPAQTWKLSSGEVIARLFISENTAIFCFDQFRDDLVMLPSGEKPFLEALEYAKKKKCDNFVVDLTCNGGGLSSTIAYMMDMMAGRVSQISKNLYTGAVRHDLLEIDRNLDGKFDEEDQKVFYDFHYAVMCSRLSYSASNIFASNAKDAGIPLLGEKSGGGGSVIDVFGTPVNGGRYYFASAHECTCNAAYEDIDGGVEVDYPMIKEGKDGKLDASMLFNPYQITKTVNQHYGISQKKNPMQLKVVKKTVRTTKVSKKKQTVKKALQVTNAKGTVTIRKVGGSKKLTISKKGVITVKKGTKRGTYKLRVKVSTEGTGIYKKASKTVTVTLKVA